jgi:hypothetical protein
MSRDVPSAQTEPGNPSSRVTALLIQQQGKGLFQLSFRGETIPLVDSSSLNRWAAVGIVERHNLSIFPDGITLDGKKIAFADPHGIEELERLLNRPDSRSQVHSKAAALSSKSSSTAAPNTVAAGGFNIQETIRVTRDGFEFHVTYKTRFGQNKTEKLETALDAFQNMRVFRPHISLQKSGIRLVVTRWDGESFIEEQGIENLEHATPEQVEYVIKSNVIGGTDLKPVTGKQGPSRPPVVRLEILRKPHDTRFHLVFHRADGTSEDGPLLIRPNMGRLAADGLFKPGIVVSMTAIHDRLIVEGGESVGGDGRRSEQFLPLHSEVEAKQAAAVLSRYLRDSTVCSEPEHGATPVRVTIGPNSSVTPAQVTAAQVTETPRVVSATQSDAPTQVEPTASTLTIATNAPSAGLVSRDLSQTLSTASVTRDWLRELFNQAQALPADEINREVFEALRAHFDRPLSTNDHDLPQINLDQRHSGDNAASPLELVLAPHYLLCTWAFGYIRFGMETRLFSNRVNDFVAFTGDALRGVVQHERGDSFAFVVCDEFADFLRGQGERSYPAQYSNLLLAVHDLTSNPELIWPLTREDRLFRLLAEAARGYGLPVDATTITLAPGASEFIGFRKASPHGIEFCEAVDSIRFTPIGIELTEDGVTRQIEASFVLTGWALDQEGRMCIFHEKGSGFEVPSDSRLVRFLSEEQQDLEKESLKVLAVLPN